MQVVIQDEDSGSPRTKVAYHFQGLRLEDGGSSGNGGAGRKLTFDLHQPQQPLPKSNTDSNHTSGWNDTDENMARKRMRMLERAPDNGLHFGSRELEIPETPMQSTVKFGIKIGPERTIDPFIEEKARGLILENETDPMIFRGSPVAKGKESGLARSYPSINRLSDSKSRAKERTKRPGTPPLFGSKDAMLEGNGDGGEMLDRERQALTWNDDEITGHNPTDPDDDGEGINGIGFRPTAAEAYVRTQKRKQQMAEYKSREAREARARRSEKRRGETSEEKEAQRRVRFLEGEKSSLMGFS